MRTPGHLPQEALDIAAMIDHGDRVKARDLLSDADPKLVLDVVYAFMPYVTVPAHAVEPGQPRQWVPADPSDPETLAVAVHVIRNFVWVL